MANYAALQSPFTLNVAVAGHRDLWPADQPAVERALDALFDAARALAPAVPLLALTALADGADQCFASRWLDRRDAAIAAMDAAQAAAWVRRCMDSLRSSDVT